VKRSAEVLLQGGSAADAVETGINAVEEDNQEQYYVGYGGFPNANGVMECDAAMMDSELNYGKKYDVLAVPVP
jgi:isoaspartyl peptidase/L-asparaginase-like protein (Ntn-hydrolase superfamily)